MKRLAKVAGLAALVTAAGATVERMFIAAPHDRGPRSDHFDGKRFHNHQSGWQSQGSFLKWQMTRRRGVWREWVNAAPGPKPETRVDGGRLRLTLINHATTLIQLDGVNILTDPIWSERCSRAQFAGPKRHRPPGIRYDDLPPIDVVLVSHNHYDHLDVNTLRALQSRPSPGASRHPLPQAGEGTEVITPLGNGALMARHGIGNAREIDWWQSQKVRGVTMTAVPAQHFSARGLSDRNACLWGGFVISGPSGNVYFAGDTGWGKHFAEVVERFKPIRLALLPIGAFLPRWFMKPAHINPEEAVDAHFALGAKTSVPMHYGTFALGDDGEMEPLDELRRAITARRAGGFEIFEFGEGRDVP